jgi:hypothetical protein
MNIVFCGDLRKLPSVNACPVFKAHRDSLGGAALWQLDMLMLDVKAFLESWFMSW